MQPLRKLGKVRHAMYYTAIVLLFLISSFDAVVSSSTLIIDSLSGLMLHNHSAESIAQLLRDLSCISNSKGKRTMIFLVFTSFVLKPINSRVHTHRRCGAC